MPYINYTPAPIEHIPDLTDCGVLKDYELNCDEYPGAYQMSLLMANLPYCDYSQPLDDFYYKNGIIFSNWTIFFTCRPRDAERLAYISRHMKYPVTIRSYKGGSVYDALC